MKQVLILLIFLSISLGAIDNFHKKYFFLDNASEAYEISFDKFIKTYLISFRSII